MGCKGSKAAEAPKPEEKVGSVTLLQEPGADSKTQQPEEPKGEAPATQGSATETADQEAVAGSTAEKAKETGTAVPAAADVMKAQETPKIEEAPTATSDATTTKAEEVRPLESPAEPSAEEAAQAATAEASAAPLAAQAIDDAKVAALDQSPVVAEGVVAEKLAEAAAGGKAEDAEIEVSAAATDAAGARKQAGCLQYCVATEAQNEIVVHN